MKDHEENSRVGGKWETMNLPNSKVMTCKCVYIMSVHTKVQTALLWLKQ